MRSTEVWNRIINGAGLEVLDEIEIYTSKINRPMIKIGFRASLYFREGYALEKRLAFVRALRVYFDRFSDHITHWQPNNANRLKTVAAGNFPPLEDEILSLAEEDDFGVEFSGYPEGINNAHQPTHYSVGGYCKHVMFGQENSSFEVQIPLSWAVKNGFDKLRDLIKKWCDILEPVHGTGGPSLLWYSADANNHMIDGLALLKKFPGLDNESVSNFDVESGYFAKQHYRIRTINWLTILGDTLIAELGGRDALQAALGDAISLIDYQGGTIIQAGPQPVFGDSELGDVPELYRRVSEVTKPVRFEAYRRGIFQGLPAPLDDLDETMKWIRRFD